MSLQLLYDQVARLEKDIADFQKKLADESAKELNKLSQIDTIKRSINKNTSVSSLESKNRQIRSYQTDIVNILKKKSDHQKKMSEKAQLLARKKQEVVKEEARLHQKQKDDRIRENHRIIQIQQQLQKDMDSTIAQQRSMIKTLEQQHAQITHTISKTHDFFISHATEDKGDFVRPLALKLVDMGCNVWYDEHQLKVGDSLRKKIDEGLKSSRYGIVVFSPDFFKKNWPDYELNGLVAREVDGVKVILPIWHRVTKNDVLNYSPSLADKIALNTALYSIDEIAQELVKLLNIGEQP
ncbi:MAG TPA: TIR domain-containing protein [Flavipsychrobacter sp.]|nr:TIR domain-containing protein [Flavipsychrobacter sp.]